MKECEKNDFLELLVKACEGTLSREETVSLNARIQADEEAAELYAEFFATVSGLIDLSEVPISFDDNSAHLDAWLNALAREEISAPIIPSPVEQSVKEPIPRVVYERLPRSVNRTSVFAAFLSAAALLFIVLFVQLAQDRSGYPVATLTQSLNDQWAGSDLAPQTGTRICADRSPRVLKEGLAELLFDTRARVIIEAPAEFQIIAEDRMHLTYGRAYAIVPQQATGFSVYTKNAKVIDLGTEFGIEIDSFGDTYLHMTKGQARLIAGRESELLSMEVSAGSAKKVSGLTHAVSDVNCNEQLFVRAFDSSSNAVWRQDPSLDLADMVRAGNGLGTGNSRVRLHPIKGFCEEYYTGFTTIRDYLPIPQLPFIDGIFVPDGERRQVVSTRGDVFEDCPDTSGIVSMDLLASPTPEILKTELRGTGTIRFNGREYSDQGRPCIVMHANHGITFDLEAIRRAYPRKITRFVSQVGIADLDEACPCNADFWVVVDGQVRYSLQRYKQKGVLNEVSVELKDTDRFLTLVTTDGGDPDQPDGGFYTRAISCDWCVFAEPVLELK